MSRLLTRDVSVRNEKSFITSRSQPTNKCYTENQHTPDPAELQAQFNMSGENDDSNVYDMTRPNDIDV